MIAKNIINEEWSLTMRTIGLSVLLGLVCGVTHADLISLGPDGINSSGLGLTGLGANIGQVEVFRPGKPGYDSNDNVNPHVNTASVWWVDVVPDPDFLIDDVNQHATVVASVMISDDDVDSNSNMNAPLGVAEQASLHSSGFEIPNQPLTNHSPVIQAMQRIALRNKNDGNLTNDVRAINMSSAVADFGGPSSPDANSQLTLAVDWSARVHDVLYVVAGNQLFGPPITIPTDNFNGMTIAKSARDSEGVFSVVDDTNYFDPTADAPGDRFSTSLIAPGIDIEVGGHEGVESVRSGTSLAAPHVTGTVALLQQRAEQRILSVGGARWGPMHDAMR